MWVCGAMNPRGPKLCVHRGSEGDGVGTATHSMGRCFENDKVLRRFHASAEKGACCGEAGESSADDNGLVHVVVVWSGSCWGGGGGVN